MIFMERFKQKMLNSNRDYLVFFAYFATVFFHELSHFIVSLLTNGKPSKINLIPSKTILVTEDEKEYVFWTLGSCESTNYKFYNAALISLAPLLLIFVAYFIFIKYFEIFPTYTFQNYICFYSLFYCLISNSIPSYEDLKLAFSKYSFIFYTFVFFIIYFNQNLIKGVLNEYL